MTATSDPFFKLNELYFKGFDAILENLKGDFRVFADAYFNSHRTPPDHDQFFNQFTPTWLNLVTAHRLFEAIKEWNFALGLALDWEERNKPHKIHKGTPYYFLGVSAILNNELENGFMAMHQALTEDKRLSGRKTPETPSLWFLILDSTKQNQFFKMKVDQIAAYLSDKLQEYSAKRGGSLSLDQFRKKFLRRRGLSEEVFAFIYSLFMLRKLADETGQFIKSNVFSSLLHSRLLFGLSLITDKAIEHRNPDAKDPNKKKKLTFVKELKFLSSSKIGLLSFDQKKISTLADDFSSNLAKALSKILHGKFSFKMCDIERDFAIAYGIRNFGAHRIENQPILYEKLPKLSQSVINTLFFTVEKLY